MQLVKLNSFYNLYDIYSHYQWHTAKELLDGEGKLIASRHEYKTSSLGKKNWREAANLEEELEQLNEWPIPHNPS